MSGSLGSPFLPASLLHSDGLRGAEVRGQACPSRHHEALTTLEPCSTRLSTPSLGQPFYGRSPPPPVVPFGARPLLAAERGLGWGKNRSCRRPISLSRYFPQTPSHQSEVSNSRAINEIAFP